MQDLVTVLSNEDGIQISLDVQQDAVLQTGKTGRFSFNIIWESMHPIYWRGWNRIQKLVCMWLIMIK